MEISRASVVAVRSVKDASVSLMERTIFENVSDKNHSADRKEIFTFKYVHQSSLMVSMVGWESLHR